MASETLTVEIAPIIAEQIDCLINEGLFASRDELVSYVLRRSLFSEESDEEDL